MRCLAALALLACTSPESPGTSPPRQAPGPALGQAPDPRPPDREVSAVLDRSGVVRLAGATYDLTLPAEAAQLGLALAAADRLGPLILEGERGTPLEHVKRLLAVLEAAHIDDYRLDLGR